MLGQRQKQFYLDGELKDACSSQVLVKKSKMSALLGSFKKSCYFFDGSVENLCVYEGELTDK